MTQKSEEPEEPISKINKLIDLNNISVKTDKSKKSLTKSLTKSLKQKITDKLTIKKIEKPKIKDNDTIFTNITKSLKEKVKNISLRANTIHLVIKYVMELVEETPLKGIEQKEISLKILRELFIDLTDGDDEKILLQLLDDGTIGNMIDLIIDATRGKINVNTAIVTSVSCLSTCIKKC